MITGEEVSKHNTTESCWVIIHGQVYDVTNFLNEHPGGSAIILRDAGKDVSEIFDPVHPEGILVASLTKEQMLGPVNLASSITKASRPQRNAKIAKPENKTPTLALCMNLDDLETNACKVMSRRAMTYITSGADSLASIKQNQKDWSKIIFRPRVLINVTHADMRCNILGKRSDLPFFIAPFAMAKLACDEGEFALVRGAVAKNIPYCVSGYSSIQHDQLMACSKEAGNSGLLFYQLYVSRMGEEATRKLIRNARNLGYQALFITVDSPVVGKREEDERYRAEEDYDAGYSEPQRHIGKWSPILRGTHSSSLSWDDLAYIRDEWGASSGPIVIKGIQTAEDAKIVADMGFDGVYLSNHGGRQLDHAPSSTRTLLEIRRFCPEILGKVQIFLDGGIRRGTDIVKAICLGATAVGIGRPFDYGIALGGVAGCNRVTQLLSDEIETSMRLLGATNLKQLCPEMVNCVELEQQLPISLPSFQAIPRARL